MYLSIILSPPKPPKNYLTKIINGISIMETISNTEQKSKETPTLIFYFLQKEFKFK